MNRGDYDGITSSETQQRNFNINRLDISWLTEYISTMAATSLIIPESSSTVDVHIIDSTSRIHGIPTDTFMEPKIKGYNVISCPAFSFLIEHPKSGQKLLFDLGVRKDWENLSTRIYNRITDAGWSVKVERGVADILKDNGVDPQSINSIIWRFCRA